jgi:hypothetical protein
VLTLRIALLCVEIAIARKDALRIHGALTAHSISFYIFAINQNCTLKYIVFLDSNNEEAVSCADFFMSTKYSKVLQKLNFRGNYAVIFRKNIEKK